MIDILKKNPFLTLLVLFFLSPSPNPQIGLLLQTTSLTLYSVIYIYTETDGDNIKEKINFIKRSLKESYKREAFLISMLIVYEVLLLLYQPLTFSNISYTIRPLFYFLLLLVGFSLSRKYSYETYLNKMLFAFYFTLLVQYFISILQFFDINVFSFIYNDVKSYPFGGLVRLTGTTGNPNSLAWFISQFTLAIVLMEKSKKKKTIFVILGLVFILLTGSRTMIVLSPLMWAFAVILKINIKKISFKTILYSIIAFLSIIVCLFIMLFLLRDVLPYASQLLNILNGGLSSVNSFRLRFIKWNSLILSLRSDLTNLLFGLRNSSYISSDNDILYGIQRSGVIGITLQYGLYLTMCFKSITSTNNQKNNGSLWVFSLIVFSIVVGLQADTLTGWTYPIFIFLFYDFSRELVDAKVFKGC